MPFPATVCFFITLAMIFQMLYFYSQVYYNRSLKFGFRKLDPDLTKKHGYLTPPCVVINGLTGCGRAQLRFLVPLQDSEVKIGADQRFSVQGNLHIILLVQEVLPNFHSILTTLKCTF